MRRRLNESKSAFRSEDAVKTVLVEGAEEMLVIDEKSPIWKSKRLGGRAMFVTLKPPPDVSDTVIEELKQRLYAEHGARVVHVVSKQKKATILEPDKPASRSADLRAVVNELIDEANSINRDTLRVRCEETMAKVGL